MEGSQKRCKYLMYQYIALYEWKDLSESFHGAIH